MNQRTLKIGATVFVMVIFVAAAVSFSFKNDRGEVSEIPNSLGMGVLDEAEYYEDDKRLAHQEGRPLTSPATDNLQQERKVIRSANISVVVSDVFKSLDVISAYAKDMNGFVVESSVSNTGTTPYGTITFRVPENTFQKAVDHVKTLGTVQDAKIHGNDVTDQYIDTEARLKNLRAAEQQFILIMKGTSKIPDILSVQTELTRVREQIEVLEAQLKNLQNSTTYSLITVSLSPDPKLLPALNQNISEWDPIIQAKDAFEALVVAGQAVVDGIIWMVIVGLPVVLLGGLLFLGGRKVIFRIRN